MALDLAALEIGVNVMLDALPWKEDCDVIEMPWRQEKIQDVRSRMSRQSEKDGKLVFAVMRCDGTTRPHPPIERALVLVTEALLAQGYEVCPVSTHRMFGLIVDSGRRLEPTTT